MNNIVNNKYRPIKHEIPAEKISQTFYGLENIPSLPEKCKNIYISNYVLLILFLFKMVTIR